MRSTMFTIGLAVLLLLGCAEDRQAQEAATDTDAEAKGTQTTEEETMPKQEEQQAKTDAELEKVEQEIKEAAQALKDFVTTKKDEYVTEAKSRFDKLDKRIDKLLAETEEQKSDALNDLKEKRKQFQQQMEELEGSSADAWRDVRRGVDDAFSELMQAYEDASSRFTSE